MFSIVRQLPADLVMLAHEGTRSYNQVFELLHRREAATPNEIWQADHSPLDILLLAPGGEAVKPWLTVVIDDYSRAAAGYFLSFDPPSVLHTSLALRQAIWRKDDSRWHVCGIPDVLYTDHGSDFISHHLEQVAADLKVRLIFSLPGKPRGRGRVERFFSTLNEMFLCGLEGYAPPAGGLRGKPRLSLAEFEILFRNFLLDAYHRRECAETKTPPAERWEANGFLPRMPESLEQLDLLLIHVAKTRQVRRDGIRFQGLRYMSADLAAYIGESVTLRLDPRDLGEVRVFYKDRFLCRAICAELAGALLRSKRSFARETDAVRNCAPCSAIASRPSIRCSKSGVEKLRRPKMPQIASRPPQPENQPPLSSDTATNSKHRPGFIETVEHRRFAEFCDACRRYAYIGLCYGPRGVGKTLSARRYSGWDSVHDTSRWLTVECASLNTVFYTPSVVNSPCAVSAEIRRGRDKLTEIARRPARLETAEKLEAIRQRDREHDAKADG